MNAPIDDRQEERQKIFARLAVFQRLREDAAKSHRDAMLKSIDHLIRNELDALQDADEQVRRA